jgi:hypothetical protein
MRLFLLENYLHQQGLRKTIKYPALLSEVHASKKIVV